MYASHVIIKPPFSRVAFIFSLIAFFLPILGQQFLRVQVKGGGFAVDRM